MDSVPRFGIPRNTPSTSGSNTYYVGASSNGAAALPNDGVQCTLQVIPLSSAVSGSLSFWCADDTSSGMWGQVGYYFFDGTTPTAFWQIWNLNTYTEVATGTTSISAGTHTFSMNLQSGTTWAYSLDGNVFGTYDMASSVSVGIGGYPVYSLSEEGYTSGPFSFPTVGFSSAMNVNLAGVWTPVLTSVSYGGSWGVEGQLQNSILNSNSLMIGSGLPALSSGTTLWNGMPSNSSTSSSTTSSTLTSSTITSTSTISTTPSSESTSASTTIAPSTTSTTSTSTSPTTTMTSSTTVVPSSTSSTLSTTTSSTATTTSTTSSSSASTSFTSSTRTATTNSTTSVRTTTSSQATSSSSTARSSTTVSSTSTSRSSTLSSSGHGHGRRK